MSPRVCALLPPPRAPTRAAAATSTAPTRTQLTQRRPHPAPPAPPKPNIASAATLALSRQHELAKFFAGGLAGAVSALFTTPLELLRTKVQASGAGRAGRSVARVAASVVRTDGLSGFYRGLPISLVGTLPSRSIYFGTYSRTKQALQRVFGEDSPIVHVLSAVAAGTTSNFFMSPLWVVRTRVQLNSRAYKGYGHAVSTMLRNEGPSSFYRGFSASLWGTSEAAIHFVLYEKLKKLQTARLAEKNPLGPKRELSALQYTLTAGFSKLVASMATYPHERVRVLMREIPKAGCAPKYRAMVQSLRLIAKEEGVAGLYRGMGCHLARTVPSTAIMFLSYEMITKNLERRHKRKLAELRVASSSASAE